MVRFHASRTHSITSGLSGSPALVTSRNFTGQSARSCWIKRRHTVGGAQKLVAEQRNITSRSLRASKRSNLYIKTQLCAFHGANMQDHACLAQPGELKFKCTSPGRRPNQYMVDRCPTG